MTTQVSQPQIPPQASNSASQSTLSYASTVKKAASSPPIATGSSTPSPAVAVGGPAPVQQHGKTNSISPANGRSSVPPAVPVVSAPVIANSSAANGVPEHSRKNSVTISANGPSGYVPNGGPVGGHKAGIPQFGSIADSPAASHSTPHVSQSNASAPIPIPGNNPRVISPSVSPSPIPQPSASGGRPPSGLAPGNGGTINFGSLDADRQRRPSFPQGPMAPGSPAQHFRRESSHSSHNEQAPGRGGFSQQAGRGRGSFTQGAPYQQQQQPGYPPAGMTNFRHNSGRGGMAGGMAPTFQNNGRPMGTQSFQGSPNMQTRSPAMQHAMPGTPNMNQAMPAMQNQQQAYNNNYYTVKPPSTSTLSALSENFTTSNRGGVAANWSRENKHFPAHQLSSEQSALGNHYAFNKQSPVELNDHGQSPAKTASGLSVPQANGVDSLQSQSNMPLQPGSSEHDASLSDQIRNMPPLPPAIPSHNPTISTVAQQGPVNLGQIDLAPESGGFEQFLTRNQPQQHYGAYPPQGYGDRMQQYPMNGGPQMMYPQAGMMGYQMGPPQSPQPGYQQPYGNQYVPGPGTQPMSRNGSQISEHRPASSTGVGQPGTPSMPPTVAHTTQQKSSPAASSFTRPPRRSAALVIKRPDGEALDVDKLKAPASPAPKDRARTPPAIASTPTPPPKSATPQHGRPESEVRKSNQQIQQELLDKVAAVKAAAESDKSIEKQDEADAETKATEIKAAEEAKVEDEKIKLQAKAAEDAKTKEAEEKAAAEKKAKEEEEEMERQIDEMERAEAEREKKEAELLAKRAVDKAKAEKAKADTEENDRKLQAQEREMERLEDEKAAKSLAAENGAKLEAKPDTKGPASATSVNIASKLSSLSLNNESGTPNPATDNSMGPPPKTTGTEKRGKPAALNLAPLNTKPVEPPQPSAALQSLKSARFLTVMNSSMYPENIRSPNPALNSAVTAKGKSFKYDKEFLLQFQKVFVEKPSLEFESQIKVLIGDPNDNTSARSANPRNAGGMGPRGSNRNQTPSSFTMGTFGSGAIGGKTLPPGTTSEERYKMATGALARPAVSTMNSFSRPGGAFGGNSMSRGSSSTGNMPQSPRQASKSQRDRQGSRRDGHQGGNAKQEAQAAAKMPLTAGMDLKPIQVTATGWKPRSIPGANATGAAGPAPGASGAPGHMEPDMVQRKVKAALNKMTPEKFDKISDQILSIAAQSKDEQDGRTLRQVIQLTFEKATDEAHWASMYAKFCKRMLETMNPDIKDESIHDKNGDVVRGGNLFRKYLLNRCQEEFERGWKMDLGEKPEGERGEEKTEEAAMLSDEYYIAAAAKRRGLGLVQFIGELYKLSMLTERIMHECVKKLVDYTGIPDEAEIESLTKLLKTIGLNLDSTEKGKPMMDVYFQRIQAMVETPALPSRLKYMLMDILDLRKLHWRSKETNKGPKTLDEVRLEAEAATAQKAAENARGPRGGGGGGRMQMGRGDGRNFSGGYNNQPPPDYNKNTVGMDDLRRLGAKGAANRNSSQQMSFGPTSMFSSRSNSGRKMGPGGSLSRGGDDSSPASRQGTPPQQKEKESATSANAFSLLANMGESENPTSPPSTANSPELNKATPASAGKSEVSKESET
ncbi:hypothetical protein BJ878DRAFT_290921 [Calycina marina]|uniref:MIF4G domain-containing protein n=1 Tax=Calycina marina TaxID=1763456 RepID=A0A9P8CGZ3_9HELO|nr:hypothetical protein BJ878DRAFT_290921 [Calycina marina]